MQEAVLYQRLDSDHVRCQLCAHHCRIAPGQRGLCGVRECRLDADGQPTLYTLVYGKLIASHVDPIEKKPLFHFYPGSRAYSVATVGCNFSCTFCQNADISQFPRQAAGQSSSTMPGQDVSPAEIVAEAQRHHCTSIAYTYSEPTVFVEYAYDTAQLARQAGLANVWVSNGYMSAEALELLCDADLMQAANIDLKAFSNDFYHDQCGARLQSVLDSLITLKQRGVWLEVTTLVIPGLNDSDDELTQIAAFICQELGADTPWHVSRFHPTYQLLDRPPTPPATVRRAREIGLAQGLAYVYTGNVSNAQGESTICPGCGHLVIQRDGYLVGQRHLVEGCCSVCGRRLAGVGL